MTRNRWSPILRDVAYCVAGAGLGTGLLASGLALLGAHGRALSGPPSSLAGLEHSAALAFAAVGLAVLAGWFLCLVAALATEALRCSGHARAAEHAARFSPAFMRRLAAAVLGTQLVLIPVANAGTAGPGGATSTGTTALAAGLPAAPTPEWKPTGTTTPEPSASATATSGAEGAPVPDWKPLPPARGMDRLLGGGGTRTRAAEEVTVVAGDSLWAIAARSLGGNATEADIAREWPRWYQTNRERVGADPDLLSIGTVLIAPDR